jgi:hypothetical protein
MAGLGQLKTDSNGRGRGNRRDRWASTLQARNPRRARSSRFTESATVQAFLDFREPEILRTTLRSFRSSACAGLYLEIDASVDQIGRVVAARSDDRLPRSNALNRDPASQIGFDLH